MSIELFAQIFEQVIQTITMLGKILMEVREILHHTYSADVDNRTSK